MGDLTLVEIRPRRQLRDLFRRDLDLRVDRRIRCSACRRSYPAGPGAPGI